MRHMAGKDIAIVGVSMGIESGERENSAADGGKEWLLYRIFVYHRIISGNIDRESGL